MRASCSYERVGLSTCVCVCVQVSLTFQQSPRQFNDDDLSKIDYNFTTSIAGPSHFMMMMKTQVDEFLATDDQKVCLNSIHDGIRNDSNCRTSESEKSGKTSSSSNQTPLTSIFDYVYSELQQGYLEDDEHRCSERGEKFHAFLGIPKEFEKV